MHTLQPQHTKLTEEETEKILQKYNIALSQLPKISQKDPILEKQFKPGEVVKIERKINNKIQEYFRVVI